jgi:hypothetical protein
MYTYSKSVEQSVKHFLDTYRLGQLSKKIN